MRCVPFALFTPWRHSVDFELSNHHSSDNTRRRPVAVLSLSRCGFKTGEPSTGSRRNSSPRHCRRQWRVTAWCDPCISITVSPRVDTRIPDHRVTQCHRWRGTRVQLLLISSWALRLLRLQLATRSSRGQCSRRQECTVCQPETCRQAWREWRMRNSRNAWRHQWPPTTESAWSETRLSNINNNNNY